jgi:hypothetical protein
MPNPFTTFRIQTCSFEGNKSLLRKKSITQEFIAPQSFFAGGCSAQLQQPRIRDEEQF